LLYTCQDHIGECLTLNRFEKSLYDLIKGLRNHKGAEEDYIQSSLRECRTEIRSPDMGALFLDIPTFQDSSGLTKSR
jgi:AP-3 complex subunit delta-1